MEGWQVPAGAGPDPGAAQAHDTPDQAEGEAGTHGDGEDYYDLGH